MDEALFVEIKVILCHEVGTIPRTNKFGKSHRKTGKLAVKATIRYTLPALPSY